ncbi:MAG: T9SS type A sorting domain-containing protein [Candidatus Delongbacteria bacterium]|nr:T9SS type A sorting domain-containing protein [Candidatus Delongbacteria bacterium]MBN2835906.1 T9SS type A sorting domain-containing protein [Candidatus Delongbacteria bacterium]
MKKILVILFSLIAVLSAGKTEYAKVKVNSFDEIQRLEKEGIIVDKSSVKDKSNIESIIVYVDETEYKFIEDLGMDIKWAPVDYSSVAKDYRDNTAIGNEMEQLETLYPDICKRIQIGTSNQNRPLWVMKISDNVNENEANEPQFKYTSTMHGDEVVPMEMCMELIYDLLEGYQADNDTMTYLVDNTEIYIMPLYNPDGNALHQRGNANGVDLNRNLPERSMNQPNIVGGYTDAYGNTTQVENAALMNWMDDNNFVLSINFHNGATVINYPWDHTPAGKDIWSKIYVASPDDETYIWLSLGYSSRNLPMYNSSSFTNGITNGADWYQITGGLQDYNYFYHSTMEVCGEVSDIKWPAYSAIPGYWADNRASMLWYMSAVHKGIKGTVTDQNGNPIAANIRIEGINKTYRSNEDFGDYNRILCPGTYTLIAEKDGYDTVTIENIVVTDPAEVINTATIVDIVMTEHEDLEAPEIVNVSGNSAVVGNDMNLTVNVYELHDIIEVKAIYTINEETIEVVMQPVAKNNNYIYTTNIPARNEITVGTLSFHTIDNLGNEDTFDGYDIQWLNIIFDGFETGDFTTVDWTFSGNEDWIISNTGAYEGMYCAQSGDIDDSETSVMEVTLDDLTASAISFFYKVDSESNYDKFSFSIDGVEKINESGNISWTEVSYPTTAGSHTFQWKYSKDSSVSNGSDCAWIDNITFPLPVVSITDTLIPAEISISQNYPNPFNPETIINFSVPSTNDVKISVFNSNGQFVSELVNNKFNRGNYSTKFDGSKLTSGVYYYQLTSGSKIITRKMMLIK